MCVGVTLGLEPRHRVQGGCTTENWHPGVLPFICYSCLRVSTPLEIYGSNDPGRSSPEAQSPGADLIYRYLCPPPHPRPSPSPWKHVTQTAFLSLNRTFWALLFVERRGEAAKVLCSAWSGVAGQPVDNSPHSVTVFLASTCRPSLHLHQNLLLSEPVSPWACFSPFPDLPPVSQLPYL